MNNDLQLQKPVLMRILASFRHLKRFKLPMLNLKTKVIWFILISSFLLISLSTKENRILLSIIQSSNDFTVFEKDLEKQQRIAEHLNDLEVFYLEEILMMNTDKKLNMEIMTSYNTYLEKEFYHFDKVEHVLTTYKSKKKFLKKYKKRSLEDRLILSLPQSLRAKAQIYIKPILVISEKYKMDPFWLTSVMWTESHFNFTAKSNVGAKGLMQIMPETKKHLLEIVAKKSIILESSKGWSYLVKVYPGINNWTEFRKFKAALLNIELGTIYLTYLLNRFDSPVEATVAYNMGPGWMYWRKKNNKPVGVKNLYLSKVLRAYNSILTNIPEA